MKKGIAAVLADFCNALKAFDTSTGNGKRNFVMGLFMVLFIILGFVAIVIYSAVALVVGLLKAIWHFLAGSHGFQWITNFTKKHPRIYRYTNSALTATVVVLLIIGINGINFDFQNRPKNLKSYQNATISACKGKVRLNGVDINTWQEDTYQKLTAGGPDVVLVKIADGENLDPYCDLVYQNAKANTKMLGGYFSVNDTTWLSCIPEDYAVWCANTVESYVGWTAFFLNVESLDASNRVSVEWVERWLDTWYENTGVRAGLYMNQGCADINPWSQSTIQNTPLWCADCDGVPALENNWNVVIAQSTYAPVNSDRFYGSAKDWWELCAQH